MTGVIISSYTGLQITIYNFTAFYSPGTWHGKLNVDIRLGRFHSHRFYYVTKITEIHLLSVLELSYKCLIFFNLSLRLWVDIDHLILIPK